MTDIVERLRAWSGAILPGGQVVGEAADEIERLRKLDVYELGYTEGERSGQVNAELKYETEIERLRGRIAELEGEKMDDWTTGRNDEIERLRSARLADSARMVQMSDEYEAAKDEIERLQAEVRRLMRILEVQII